SGWHRTRRSQARDGGGVCRRAEVHGRRRRLVRRRQLRDVRSRLLPTPALDVAERADLGHGRRAGGNRADDGRRRGRRRDPREVRGRGQPVLLDGASVGRRDHRPARHPSRSRARHLGGAERADPGVAVRHLPNVEGSMLGRLVLWNLADSLTNVGELRRYLREESVDKFATLPGLLFKAWVSDETTERWGAVYVWESREAAQQELPSRARELIGKEPQIVELFDLEATVSVAPQLAHLGLAFDDDLLS